MAENETEVWISPRKAKYIANREAFMAYLLERGDKPVEDETDG
ncbi:hypothetical protein SAMN04487914_10868 [Arthrobacter sp. ok909]|nr:hypothetical protein [Arthrobacter sp. ok909]SDP32824.1 hypothetical protein SAMN04487914_10868 [Arthrobacter sp. ok909]